ncbi:MAG: trans-4-hydroxy-L-proline dehydratase [Anaerolineae bacterium]|jgi:formate C-acetyltransferase|nr:trans-4-hydroxy-L-proline dehydratase [Anaerolineae bacterium]
MNNRIQRLREISLNTHPRLSLERARLMTEAYQRYEGRVSIPELRALALLHYMKHRALYIGADELIVGEKGPAPQTAPTFPELCCHSVEDMEIMRSRALIPFDSTDQDLAFQREVIIPFWEERSIRHRILSVLPEEWKACYGSGIFTEFMEQRGPGHTVGSHMIYEKGFLDWQAEIDQAIKDLDFIHDPKANEKREQLTAMHIACDAIMLFGKRYAEYARELAAQETNPQRKQELLLIAHNCEVVPAKKPENFHQAIQMYWFVHLCVTSEVNPWDSYSPGRLDQHLYSFYCEGLQENNLTDEAALELLECLWIKFNNQPAPPKVGVTLKESGTYTDFANLNTGGITADGADGVNPVSYLILDCMDEMRLLQPSSNVQISRKTPHKFLRRACEITRKGWGQPAFYNTEAIIQELLTAGKSLADARLGGTSGCVETGAFGNEAYILTGYFNLPKILELTLHDGYDPVTQKQLGLHTGHAGDFTTYDELFAAYKKQIEHFVEIKVKGSNLIEAIYARYMPVPFLSVITNDCIRTGLDYNAGGARYNTSYLQGVGIGTVTDSLTAIKVNVYDHLRFTMPELLDALHNNFDGYTEILNTVKNHTPKYGNDDDTADEIMRAVFEAYHSTVTGRPNTRGGEFRINMLPTTCHVYFGEVMQASADGRFAGKPVSEGISPVQGVDVLGPTAVIQSAAKMNQLSTGGTLLNQKFSPSMVAGEQGLENMATIIRAYFDQDGHHIQFNVVDRETLLAAQEHPEDYRSLIVRVAGYSDYFRNLSRTLQDEIIARTEQQF